MELKKDYQVKAYQDREFIEDVGGEVSERTQWAFCECTYSGSEVCYHYIIAVFSIKDDANDYLEFKNSQRNK